MEYQGPKYHYIGPWEYGHQNFQHNVEKTINVKFQG